MTPQQLVRFIHDRRWPLNSEAQLQEAIHLDMEHSGVEVRREVRLGPKDRIDFIVADGIGLECKIRGQKREIYRQCERYCGFDEITGLVLATSVAMGMPAFINGKPILVASLGRGWL